MEPGPALEDPAEAVDGLQDEFRVAGGLDDVLDGGLCRIQRLVLESAVVLYLGADAAFAGVADAPLDGGRGEPDLVGDAPDGPALGFELEAAFGFLGGLGRVAPARGSPTRAHGSSVVGERE